MKTDLVKIIHCENCPNCGRGGCSVGHSSAKYKKNIYGIFPQREIRYHCLKG